MSVRRQIEASLAQLAFAHREEDYHHHSYEEDMQQYEYMRRGDARAVAEGKRLFEGPTTGTVSDDPVRNYQYLFVASITLASRFCMEGGMSTEDALNLSDLYIHRVDACRTVEEIFSLHDTMFRDYVKRMQGIVRREVYSRQVVACMDYIEQHLQQPLTVKALALEMGISPAYLSVLFKKETGMAVSEYIRRKRIDTAQTLLQYTDFSCIEIAEYLCFSSDSHFTSVFRRYTGMTPSVFRKQHYRRHWAAKNAPKDA